MTESDFTTALRALTEKKRKIEGLLRRRFPFSWAPVPLQPSTGARASNHRIGLHQETMKAVEADRLALMAEPDNVIDSLYAEMEKSKRAADRERLATEEEARPFNQPDAAADFGYWVQMQRWSVEEASALLLNRSPDAVSAQKMKQLAGVSDFAAQYCRLRRLMERSSDLEFGAVLLEPVKFVGWAAKAGLEVSTDLLTLLAAPVQNPSAQAVRTQTGPQLADVTPSSFEETSRDETDVAALHVADLEVFEAKPSRQTQDACVLKILNGLGYDPLNMPVWCRGTKYQPKQEVLARVALHARVLTESTFLKAWQRCLKNGRLLVPRR